MDAEPIVLDDDVHEEFVSELFHENTKQRRSDSRFIERIMAASFDPAVQQVMGPAHKIYPAAGVIALPAKLPRAKRNFDAAVLTRRSVREFSGKSLRLGEVAKLLHFSNGVTGVIEGGNGFKQPLRAAPSGGALYPVEMYLLALKVNGLRRGVYHYNPVENQLEGISSKDPTQEIVRITYVPELKDAAAIIALTGISMKNRVKYGERGYRFVVMEAGHIAQNLLLTANALMLSAFSIGGFVDDELDNLLGVDGFDESSLYLMAVGRPRPAGRNRSRND